MEPPEFITTPLYPHQKKALHWMADKERLRTEYSDEYKVRLQYTYFVC